MITFKVQRYIPDKNPKPYWQSYEVPVEQGMTALDCLTYIKEHLDATLSYRASCRMGICGSCGMYIHDRPRLACETQVLPLKAGTIALKALPNYEVIRDLVVDLGPLFEKHKQIKPWLIPVNPGELDQPTREYVQTPHQVGDYMQFAYCLKCGICLASCPTMATDRQFLGPQAMAQAYRYNSDSRDAGNRERLRQVDVGHGLSGCHMAGSCAEACPKGVDPALGIQLLKREAVFGRKKVLSGLATPPEKAVRRSDIPEAPAPTVKVAGSE